MTLPNRRDVAVAVAAVLVDLLLFSDLVVESSADRLDSHSSPVLPVVLGFVAFGLLMWRRRLPVGVFAAMCIHAATISLLLSYRPVVPVCVALGTVAAHERGRVTVGAFVAALLTSGAWISNEARASAEVTSTSVLVVIGVAYALILLTVTAAGRRHYVAHRREGQLESFHREEAAKTVERERLRVARELHDIVAHTITLMMLQAAGARATMRHDVDAAESALTTVERAGKQAMNELRRLLGVLRAGRQVEEYSEFVEPGDLEPLVEGFRMAGLSVSVNKPDAIHADVSVELAIYRVVQESLTNVVKHAGPDATARVDVTRREGDLEVVVSNEGGSPDPQGLSAGYGLVGLGERVALAGGTLTAKPRASSGFCVRATFPLSEMSHGDIDLVDRSLRSP